MTWPIALLIFVTLQRLAELVLARRNTAALMAQGAVEHGAGHYPLMVAFHSAWLAALWVWGWNSTINVSWLVVYGLLQMFRLWILASLGARWTTRIITLPGEQLVKRGPYRFLRHPNYALVALEVPVLPLALSLPLIALAFGVLNLAVLALRISQEERALAPARSAGSAINRG